MQAKIHKKGRHSNILKQDAEIWELHYITHTHTEVAPPPARYSA